ncbi:unnamed protein product, partial [Brenthis ino]
MKIVLLQFTMPLKLYKMDISPPVCGTLMVIDLLKVPVEFVDVDLLNKEHLAPEYLEKNPMHTVPLLEDGDLYIHESHTIMAYLCDVYGKDDSLYPKDPKQRALVDQKLYFDGQFFIRARNISYPAIFEGVRKPSEKVINAVIESYDFLEAFLSKTKFIAGDKMTIADIAILSTLGATRFMVPVANKKYTKLTAWYTNMTQQPFYQKYGAPGAIGLANLLKDKLDI